MNAANPSRAAVGISEQMRERAPEQKARNSPSSKRPRVSEQMREQVSEQAEQASAQAPEKPLAQVPGRPLAQAPAPLSRAEFDCLVKRVCCGHASEAERASLAPFQVRRAVILAAGMGTRIAPLSFEMPKALLKVRGEVLIERLIGQLREVGVERIAVVVGYMKETLFYLEDAFGVEVLVAPHYLDRNNASSLFVASDLLPGAYVCSADQYFTENPFERYAYGSRCAVVSFSGDTEEYAVDVDSAGIIVAARRASHPAHCMRGLAYFDGHVGAEFARILAQECEKPANHQALWEDIYVAHLDVLPLEARIIPDGALHEFDVLDDLRTFDPQFIDNVDSAILDNICAIVSCSRCDIQGIVPIKQGLTNLSFRFDVRGETYVYRHPGAGTGEIINRQSEAFAQTVAKKIGLDDTFVFEDSETGWKVSRFIKGCSDFDYRNPSQVAHALRLIRRLHECGETMLWSFDFAEQARKMRRLLDWEPYPLPPDLDNLSGLIKYLVEHMERERGEPCLCHNDFYGPNVLVRGDDMWIIDWEYAAMGDYACDLGNFVSQGSGYTVDEAIAMLEVYFDRAPTPQEVRHCLGAVALVGYYWYLWALFKQAKGTPMGKWLYIWYRSAKTFGAYARTLYDEHEERPGSRGERPDSRGESSDSRGESPGSRGESCGS